MNNITQGARPTNADSQQGMGKPSMLDNILGQGGLLSGSIGGLLYNSEEFDNLLKKLGLGGLSNGQDANQMNKSPIANTTFSNPGMQDVNNLLGR